MVLTTLQCIHMAMPLYIPNIGGFLPPSSLTTPVLFTHVSLTLLLANICSFYYSVNIDVCYISLCLLHIPYNVSICASLHSYSYYVICLSLTCGSIFTSFS